MADLKISALTGASTPLAGTEVLPIVQSGSTVKVSVANLTAGRAVATAGGSFTDNITQSTAGKGVNFTANANAAGMTSELLNWYEEGTWTPTVTAVSGAYTTVQFETGRYTRVGRMVHIVWSFTVTSTGTGASAYRVAGLPFAINQTGLTAYTGSGYNNSTAVAHTIYASGSGTTIDVYKYDGTNPVVVNQGMVGSCTYFV